MEEIKQVLSRLLELIGMGTEEISNSVTNFISKLLVDMTSDLFTTSLNNVLNGLKSTNILTNVMIPVGVCIMLVYFLVSLIDKVEKDRFNLEVLLKSFMKMVIGYILIANSFNIALGINGFTEAMMTDIKDTVLVGQVMADDSGTDKTAVDDYKAKKEKIAEHTIDTRKKLDPAYDPAKEMEEEDEKDKDEETTEEDKKEDNTPTSTQPIYDTSQGEFAATDSLSGEYAEWAKEVYGILRPLGYSDAAIAGIIGNGLSESGGSGGPLANVYNGEDYVGFWQMSRSAQWGGCQTYCESKGLDPLTITGQLNYILDKHLKSDMKAYAGITLDDFKNLDNPELACDAFCTAYERCVGTTANGDDQYSVYKPGQIYQNLGGRRRNSNRAYNWIAETYGINGTYTGGSTSSQLKDEFTTSMSAKQTMVAVEEMTIMSIAFIFIIFAMNCVCYIRSIKIGYMIVLMPIALADMFSGNDLTTKGKTFFKKLLALFLQYPVVYIMSLFATLIESATVSVAGTNGVMASIGVMVMIMVVLVISIFKSDSIVEGFLS